MAKSDPGPRDGTPDARGPITGPSAEEERFFWTGWEKFNEADSVSGTIEKVVGVGSNFNGSNCARCHAQPAAGGSSSSPRSPQVRRVIMRDQHLALDSESKPQVALAALNRVPGGIQTVPSFIFQDDPVPVARFIKKPDGTPHGDVREIYTIAGRTSACSIRSLGESVALSRNGQVLIGQILRMRT